MLSDRNPSPSSDSEQRSPSGPPDPMKVAIIVHSFPKLSESFILNHIVSLIRHGAEVTVFSFYRSTDTIQHSEVEEYGLLDKTSYCVRMPISRASKIRKALKLLPSRLVRMPAVTLRSLSIVKYGRQALNLRLFFYTSAFEGQEFDIVHAHFGPIGEIALQLRELGAISGPLLVSFHGYDLNGYEFATEGRYKTLFARSEIIFANSEFGRQRLLSLGAPRDKVLVGRMSVDLDKFHGNRGTSDAATLTLLSVSRLSREKGLIFGLMAFRRFLEATSAKAVYYIIGSGPEASNLKTYVRESGLRGRVEFLGAQSSDKVVEYMSKADIFLFPSIQLETGEVDTQGLVLQEAQAMRIPVIASDVGGVSSGLVAGGSGYLVPQKSIDDLASRIETLASDPALRRNMGVIGRQFISERFANQEFTRRLMATYSSVMSQARAS